MLQRITLYLGTPKPAWMMSRNDKTFLSSFWLMRLQVLYIETSTQGAAKIMAAANMLTEIVFLQHATESRPAHTKQ